MRIDFEKVHLYRKKRKITVKGFCELCGIGRTTLWGWEHGKAQPIEEKVRVMARVLDIPVREISDIPAVLDFPEGEYSKSVKETVNSWLSFLQDEVDLEEVKYFKKKIADVENKLKNGSTIIKAMMMSLREIFYIKDVNLKYVIANEAFLDNISLLKNYNVLGKKDEDFFSIIDAKENEAEDRKVVFEDCSIINREGYIPGSKKKKWGVFSKYPIKSSTGNIIGVIAIIKDMTDFKIEAKARIILEKTLDNIEDISISIGHFSNNNRNDFTFDYVNSTMKKFFSIESEKDYKDLPELIENIIPDESKKIFEERKNIKKYPAHFIYKAVSPAKKEDVWLQDSVYNINDRIVSIIRDITELKLAEEKRIDLEIGLNLLDDCIWTAELDGETLRMTFASKSLERMTGFTREELYKDFSLFIQCIHPDDIQVAMEYMKLSFYPNSIEYRLVNRKTGKIITVQDTIYKFGKILVGFAKDISETKKIKRLEELLEFYVRGMSHGFAIINIATQKFEYLNDKFGQIFEIETEKLQEMGAGKWFIQYLHPEDRLNMTIQELKNVNKAKQFRAFTTSNKELYISAKTEIKKFNYKLCLILIIEDITSNTKISNQLSDPAFILDAVPAAVNLLKFDTLESVFSNNKLEEIFGYPEEKVLDWNFWLNNIVHPDDRNEQEKYIKSKSFPESRTYRIIKPDGTECTIKNSHVIKEKNGSKYIVLTDSLLA